MNDKLEIIEVVHNWALWRDAGDWERFRTVWHDDGWMTATWFQGPAAKFIKVSKAGFDKGVSILHFLGGSSVDVEGQPRGGADQDDDQPARQPSTARWSTWCAPAASTISSRRRDRTLGHRAPPADLREGPHGSGEPVGAAEAWTRNC